MAQAGDGVADASSDGIDDEEGAKRIAEGKDGGDSGNGNDDDVGERGVLAPSTAPGKEEGGEDQEEQQQKKGEVPTSPATDESPDDKAADSPTTVMTTTKLGKGKAVPLMTDCVICMEAFVAGEPCLHLPCSHIFHKACITDWFH